MRITVDLPDDQDSPLAALHNLARELGGELRCADYGRQHYAIQRESANAATNANVVKLPRYHGQYRTNPGAENPTDPAA